MKISFKARLAGVGLSGALSMAILYTKEITDFLRVVINLLKQLIH